MVEVMARVAARVSWTAVLAAACTALFVLGVAGLAGAQPGTGAAAGYTAVSGEFPLGTKLVVTREEASVVVRVNDRGPLGGGVELGLSGAAAEEIGLAFGGTAIVDVLVANTDAPVGPLSTTRGASVSSNVVSVGRRQGDDFSRDARMRLVVDGIEIADSKVVEMVATSTGAAPEGLAPGTSGDPGSGGGQYSARQHDQYQYDQYQYDDPQYGEAQRDGYQYASPQYAEASHHDDPENVRLGQGSDDEAASATSPVAMEGDDDAAPPVERFTGASSRADRASVGSDTGQGSLSRNGGGPKQLPATGGVPLAGALWAGLLLSLGIGGCLIRKTAGPAGLR